MMRLPRNFRLSALSSIPVVLSRIVPQQSTEKLAVLIDDNEFSGRVANPYDIYTRGQVNR